MTNDACSQEGHLTLLLSRYLNSFFMLSFLASYRFYDKVGNSGCPGGVPAMADAVELLDGLEWLDRSSGLAFRPDSGEVVSVPYWRTEASRS